MNTNPTIQPSSLKSTANDHEGQQHEYRDWVGTTFGLVFLLVAGLVMFPWLLSMVTPYQLRKGFRWVLAPLLLLMGALGLLASRRGRNKH